MWTQKGQNIIIIGVEEDDGNDRKEERTNEWTDEMRSFIYIIYSFVSFDDAYRFK